MTIPTLDVPTLPRSAGGLPRRDTPPDRLLTEKRRRIVDDVRANGRRLYWPEARRVQGVQIALNLKPLAAYRLWYWWTAEEAVGNIQGGRRRGRYRTGVHHRRPDRVGVRPAARAPGPAGRRVQGVPHPT